MTQTTLEEVRGAAGAKLGSIDGLAVHDRLGGPYNFPCAVISWQGIAEEQTRETMGATGILILDVLVDVLVGRSDESIAQSALDAYMDWAGDLSLSAALERDQSLGGVAESVKWAGWNRFQPVDVEGYSAWGAQARFTIRVQRERD